MILLLLILGTSCIVHISSQIIHIPSHSYILKKFSLEDLKKSSEENIDDTTPDSIEKRMIIEQRTQLTQLNKLLKKPVFNFANLFRRY